MTGWSQAISRVAGPEAVARARSATGGVWRSVFTSLGVYQPIPKLEKALVRTETVAFKGDAPVQIQPSAHEQGRMEFHAPRPMFEEVENLTVTPRGGGWASGRLRERYSAGAAGIRMLTEPREPQSTVDHGVVVQSAHCNTFGDWVSEYLCPIARAMPFDMPLYLPRLMAEQPYVQRDLRALGVRWSPVNEPLLIKRARVLRQQKHFVHFRREDAAVLRGLWPSTVDEARPESFVYLSRRGDHSQVAQRSYPSDFIEALVDARGGRIVRAATATRADYDAAAEYSETLIFDHGSAIYNTIGWPVRRIVEIVSDAWWNNAFLMLADAIGIEDITLIRAGLGEEHIRSRLNMLLDSALDEELDPPRGT